MAAALRFDIEAACSYLAPGFTMVTNRGSLIDAEQWRHNLSHRVTVVSGGFAESEVQVYDDVALMLSRFKLQATFDGQDWSDETYITDVWVKHDAQWHVLRRHSTTYDPAAS
jgi:ketosteroid isomerase-like protein